MVATRLEQHFRETNQEEERPEYGRAHACNADDEILKNTFANLAFENYEFASYESLISMARAGGFDAAAAISHCARKKPCPTGSERTWTQSLANILAGSPQARGVTASGTGVAGRKRPEMHR